MDMRISRMPQGKSACILIVCLLYQIGCASTKNVPIYRDDYDTLEKNQVVYIYMNDGTFYELIKVRVENGYISGTIKYEGKQIKIAIEDINYVTADKQVMTAVGFVQGILIFTAIVALIILITCSISANS